MSAVPGEAEAPYRYREMLFRRSGRSGLLLPLISLGLWQNFGGDAPTEESRAIVRRAFELGTLSKDMLNDATLARIRALNEIAKRRGQKLAQLALAWVLHDRRVTSALIGASSVAQLEQNVGAIEKLEFSADELAEIDRHALEAVSA